MVGGKDVAKELAAIGQRHKVCDDDGTTIKLSAGTDLNTITKTGFYTGKTMVNGPASLGEVWMYIEVIALSPTNVLQKAYHMFEHTACYIRRKPYEGTDWTPWIAMATEKDIDGVKQLATEIKTKTEKDIHTCKQRKLTLKPEFQSVDSDQDTLINLHKIQGRTILPVYNAKQVEIKISLSGVAPGWFWPLDENREGKYSIENGFQKIESLATDKRDWSRFVRPPEFKAHAGKRYVAVADVETSWARFTIDLSLGTGNTSQQRGGTTNGTQYAKGIAKVDAENAKVYLYNSSEAGKESWIKVKDVNVYEVSQELYDAIGDTITEDNIRKYLPHTTTITNVVNPYIVLEHGSLLPPFMGGDLLPGTQILSDYKIKLPAIKSFEITFPRNPNFHYTLSFLASGTIGGKLGLWKFKLNGAGSGSTIDIKSGLNSVSDLACAEYVRGAIILENIPEGLILENPMLVRGNKPQPFAPKRKSMWAAECELAADPRDGSDPDVLYVGDDGLPYVVERWGKRDVLDLAPKPKVCQRLSGFVRIQLTELPGEFGYNSNEDDTNHVYLQKYDGTMIENDDRVNGTDKKPDTFRLASGFIWISISNEDSGWGDGYTPTSEEIKAYFYGWRMCQKGTTNTYTTGYKEWRRIMDNGGVTTDYPMFSYPGYKPYRLQYRKPTATVERVHKYEAGAMMYKGTNRIEVGSGIQLQGQRKPTYIGTPTLSAPVDVTLADNLRSTVTDVVQHVSDVEKKIGLINNRTLKLTEKANWIMPTLLNGFKVFAPWNIGQLVEYYKDAFGIVRLKGRLTYGGQKLDSAYVFELPAGYRPKGELEFQIAITYSSMIVWVIVEKTGKVKLQKHGGMEVGLGYPLYSISFLAEQ